MHGAGMERDLSADDQTFHDDIEAYCTPQSVVVGPNDTVTVALHASTRSERFDVVVERWGAARDVVWRAADLLGEFGSGRHRLGSQHGLLQVRRTHR